VSSPSHEQLTDDRLSSTATHASRCQPAIVPDERRDRCRRHWPSLPRTRQRPNGIAGPTTRRRRRMPSPAVRPGPVHAITRPRVWGRRASGRENFDQRRPRHAKRRARPARRCHSLQHKSNIKATAPPGGLLDRCPATTTAKCLYATRDSLRVYADDTTGDLPLSIDNASSSSENPIGPSIRRPAGIFVSQGMAHSESR